MPTVVDTAPALDYDTLLRRLHGIGEEVAAPAAADVDANARFPAEAFEALAAEGLMSAYVSPEFGGMGLTVRQVCQICEVLGRFCASTAMIYAMHQIQVACILHHGNESPYFRNFLRRIVEEQLLVASATTELGVGGDLRRSICAVEHKGQGFSLTKKAPVISYGSAADAILVTARRSREAPENDQVQVLVERDQTRLDEIAGWDTLGYRGTCSSGYELTATGVAAQILPAPFGDILTKTMHPFSHLTWGSLWLGLASDAVARARASVRKKMLGNPRVQPVEALRLAELDEVMFGMRSGLEAVLAEYEALLAGEDADAFSNLGFAVRVNNVKVTCSEKVVDIVARALMIIGISGYKNDSASSVCRHLRDAYGAALMVNNDRIRGHNATVQVVRGS